MSRLVRFLPVALLLLLLVALGWRLARPADPNIRSQLEGKPVPAFTLPAALPSVPGLSSRDLATGKPKLLNFFASWCAPCIAEAPVLKALAARGVTIEGIAVRDRPEELAAFLQRNGNPYAHIGSDTNSKVQLALGSSGVPESFIIDGKGVIRFQHIGPIAPDQIPEILRRMEAAQ